LCLDLLGRSPPHKQHEHRQRGRQDGQRQISFTNSDIVSHCRITIAASLSFILPAVRRLGIARFLLVLALGMFCAPAMLYAATAPSFRSDSAIESDTGYRLIEWDASGPATLAIVPPEAAPRELYSGSNEAFFISGLADGTYRLTLRDAAGREAPPLDLHVTHQSVTQALWLVALGAIVFLATVVAVLRGARDD
jgi:hypothetical protein